MHKQPPEGLSTEDPATQESQLIMIGVFTTEATIKIKALRREELIRMEKHMHLATVADGQTAASWVEGKTNCRYSP